MSNVLCLACSASLPPSAKRAVYWTSCCSRPICPSCMASNPRLARYKPCLACLSGVSIFTTPPSGSRMNVDAAIRDEETFVLGGEDDEDIESHDPEMVMGTPSTVSVAPKEALSEAQDPTLYIVKPGDTLLGISMRLRVNGRELCRLNSLPSSTLTTTPHILHTRTTLVLPGHVPKPTTPNSIADASSTTSGSDLARARERAEKRLQTLTKEVDWRVAKAYVALADDPDEEALHVMKRKEMGSGNRDAAETHLEGTALDRYFDDDAWEAEEVRAGRGVAIRRMPLPLARKIKI